jgi:four helix bundle protein
MIRDVTELEIYNLSLEHLESLYKLANLLPPNHKRIRYQVTEAGEKIAPQIAEGFGKKRAPKEFCRFLSMALGSSDEVITHIREIMIVGKTYTSINIAECEALIEKYKLLSKKINKLHSVWQRFN